jgi:hypothetical protein
MTSHTGAVRFSSYSTGSAVFLADKTARGSEEQTVNILNFDLSGVEVQPQTSLEEERDNPEVIRREYFPFMESVDVVETLKKKHA